MTSLYNNAIFVSSPSQIPQEAHYAIIEGGSYTIPGDARSRTNPGHGYPASTESIIKYRAYLKKEDWEAEIEEMTIRRTTFRALFVEPAQVTTKVEVTRRG